VTGVSVELTLSLLHEVSYDTGPSPCRKKAGWQRVTPPLSQKHT